jgi:hypothetical protein
MDALHEIGKIGGKGALSVRLGLGGQTPREVTLFARPTSGCTSDNLASRRTVMKHSRLLIVTLLTAALAACGVSDPVGPRRDIKPVLDRQISAPADTTMASPASADSLPSQVAPEVKNKTGGSDS